MQAESHRAVRGPLRSQDSSHLRVGQRGPGSAQGVQSTAYPATRQSRDIATSGCDVAANASILGEVEALSEEGGAGARRQWFGRTHRPASVARNDIAIPQRGRASAKSDSHDRARRLRRQRLDEKGSSYFPPVFVQRRPERVSRQNELSRFSVDFSRCSVTS